jgi:hypothetical protein
MLHDFITVEASVGGERFSFRFAESVRAPPKAIESMAVLAVKMEPKTECVHEDNGR